MAELRPEMRFQLRREGCGHLRRSHAIAQHDGALLLPCLVPKIALDEGLKRSRPTLYEQRLNVVAPKAVQQCIDVGVGLKASIQRLLTDTSQYASQRISAPIGTHIQAWAVKLKRAAAHQNRLMCGAQMMHVNRGKRGGKARGRPIVVGMAQAVNVSVSARRPFSA